MGSFTACQKPLSELLVKYVQGFVSKFVCSTQNREKFPLQGGGGLLIWLCGPQHVPPCTDRWRAGRLVSSARYRQLSARGALTGSTGGCSTTRPSCGHTLPVSTELSLCPRLPASLRDSLQKQRKIVSLLLSNRRKGRAKNERRQKGGGN